MFLTAVQLYDLTHYKQPFRQRQALAQMGIPFRLRPDGTVAVAACLFNGDGQRATIQTNKPRVRVPSGKTAQA